MKTLNFKRLSILMFCFLALGCSSEQEQQQVTPYTLPQETFGVYKNTELQLQYPIAYKVQTKSQIAQSYSNSLELLFESNTPGPTTTSVIVVEKFSMPSSTNLNQVAAAFRKDNSRKLINFSEMPTQNINLVSAGQYTPSMILNFRGRRTLVANDLEFYQTFNIKSGKLFVITAAFDPLDPMNERSMLIESLKTISLF